VHQHKGEEVSATEREVSAETFIEASREGLAIQTRAHAEMWGFGTEKTWSADLDRGVIEFHLEGGKTVSAPVQVIGSYNTDDGTFLWGWDHPSVPPDLARHANLARVWGEEMVSPAFTSRKVMCSEDDAWSFAAVANRLGEGNGVYRGVAGSAYFFMTLGRLTIEQRDA
jgi:hypothetical protein